MVVNILENFSGKPIVLRLADIETRFEKTFLQVYSSHMQQIQSGKNVSKGLTTFSFTIHLFISSVSILCRGEIESIRIDIPVVNNFCSPAPQEQAECTETVFDNTLHSGWPVDLSTPGAGFPYTPTLFDMDGDGADEIFLNG